MLRTDSIMYRIKIYFAFLGCLLFNWVGAQEENSDSLLSTLNESEVSYFQILVQGNNRFAFDFYQQIKNQPGNLYFSPYSIVTGLGMPSIGAKGKTADQFQHAFRYSLNLLLFVGDLNESLRNPSVSKNATQVVLANALWLDSNLSILSSFKQKFLRDFRENLQSIDFANGLGQSIQKMNQWILHQTNGKIASMLSVQDVTGKMRMILTTAAYLKGQWAYPFDHKLTKRLPFRDRTQRTFLVNMMQNTSDYLLREGEQEDIVILPYKYDDQGAQLSMVIFLPKKEIPLNEWEKSFTWENWKQWKDQFKNRRIAMSIPRFHIEKRIDLEAILKPMDLTFMFSPEADFSRITTEKDLFLNKAFHKTFLRVTERGTEIGGTIDKEVKAGRIESETPYEFIADHPFVFIIWDQKTESIVFMGRLLVP